MRRLALLVAACATAACGVEWRQTSDSGGRFSVDLPGPAKQVGSEVKTSHGPLLLEGYMAHARPSPSFFRHSSLYVAQYADISKIALTERGGLLDEVVKARLQERQSREGGKLLYQKAFAVLGCSGTEIEVELRSVRTRQRVCMIGDRIYDLEVTGPEEHVGGQYAQRFFESFRPL